VIHLTEGKTYNGWSNYETWLVDLWLDNEQSTYNDIRNLVEENKAEEPYIVGDLIKEYVNDMLDSQLEGSGLAVDLLNSALSEVDFREIAQNHLDELDD
jgi:hypothetical protein